MKTTIDSTYNGISLNKGENSPTESVMQTELFEYEAMKAHPPPHLTINRAHLYMSLSYQVLFYRSDDDSIIKRYVILLAIP